MVTRRSPQPAHYDFLRRRALKNAKQAAKNTFGEDFAFGKRPVRSTRKKPAGR